MPMRFKPSGKRQVRHIYRRLPPPETDEWDSCPFSACCLEDDPLRECLQPEIERLC